MNHTKLTKRGHCIASTMNFVCFIYNSCKNIKVRIGRKFIKNKNTFLGVDAFETICFKHTQELKKALNCNQISSKEYSWNNPNAQIDLVIDRDDSIVNLCETKFYDDEFTIDENYLQQLRKKEHEFRAITKSKKGVRTSILSTWGVKENQFSQAILVNKIKMDCLFEKV